MEQGTRTRTTAATHMNANSSRSHMLIILQLKQVKSLQIKLFFSSCCAGVRILSSSVCCWLYCQIFSKESITKQSNINLVDLAGSERQRSSGSEADRLKEGTAINLSLTTLGNVIRSAALCFVTFRFHSAWFVRSCHITPLLQLPRWCGRGQEGRPYTLQRLSSHQVAAVCAGRQQSHCYGNRK